MAYTRSGWTNKTDGVDIQSAVPVNSAFGNIDTAIGEIEYDVESVDGRITETETDVEELKNDIGTINLTLSRHDQEIDNIEDDVENQGNRITSSESDIESLGNRMITAESDIDILETNIELKENAIYKITEIDETRKSTTHYTSEKAVVDYVESKSKKLIAKIITGYSPLEEQTTFVANTYYEQTGEGEAMHYELLSIEPQDWDQYNKYYKKAEESERASSIQIPVDINDVEFYFASPIDVSTLLVHFYFYSANKVSSANLIYDKNVGRMIHSSSAANLIINRYGDKFIITAKTNNVDDISVGQIDLNKNIKLLRMIPNSSGGTMPFPNDVEIYIYGK